MERRADRELADLRALVIRMGSLSESILDKALRSTLDSSQELALEVRVDDLEIDRLDVEIDEAIMRVLALLAPVAKDLRIVLASKSVATDLERVGDIARNIALCAIRLGSLPRVEPPAALRVLMEDSQRCLREALAAFATTDSSLARKVIDSDDQVDEGEARVMKASIDRISGSPAQAEQSLNYIFMASNLERVADHATNIAEDVILVAEALNLKHASKLVQ